MLPPFFVDYFIALLRLVSSLAHYEGVFDSQYGNPDVRLSVLETNMSLLKVVGKMIFLFQRLDMFVSWTVMSWNSVFLVLKKRTDIIRASLVIQHTFHFSMRHQHFGVFRITWPIPSPVQLTRWDVEERPPGVMYFHVYSPIILTFLIDLNKTSPQTWKLAEIMVSRSSMFLLISEKESRNLIYIE